MDLFVITTVSEIFLLSNGHFFTCILLLVASIDGVKLIDPYLQEQLEKVLNKTLTDHKPAAAAASNSIRILFNSSHVPAPSANAITTTTSKISDQSNILHVSYCYSTKEWRCLYRCEIDSSIKNNDVSKVDLTLFGSVNNPTEEDWSQIELILVANELEILSNNKTTTTPPMLGAERETAASGSRSSGGGMQVYVKTLTGKTITIDVRRNEDLLRHFLLLFFRRSRHRIRSTRLNKKFKIKKVFLPINNE